MSTHRVGWFRALVCLSGILFTGAGEARRFPVLPSLLFLFPCRKGFCLTLVLGGRSSFRVVPHFLAFSL